MLGQVMHGNFFLPDMVHGQVLMIFLSSSTPANACNMADLLTYPPLIYFSQSGLVHSRLSDSRVDKVAMQRKAFSGEGYRRKGGKE